MLVRAQVDGREMKVQIVKRKNGTVYIRKYEERPPTENQFRIRQQLAVASISSFGKRREEVVDSVRNSIASVSEPSFLNSTEKTLAQQYPEVYSIVSKRKPVSARYPVPGEEENMRA